MKLLRALSLLGLVCAVAGPPAIAGAATHACPANGTVRAAGLVDSGKCHACLARVIGRMALPRRQGPCGHLAESGQDATGHRHGTPHATLQRQHPPAQVTPGRVAGVRQAVRSALSHTRQPAQPTQAMGLTCRQGTAPSPTCKQRLGARRAPDQPS